MGTRSKRVVVTGMGVVAPGAPDVSSFRDLCHDGRSAVQRCEMDRMNGPRIAGRVEGFLPTKADGTEHLDRYALLALHASREAISQSRLLGPDSRLFATIRAQDVGVTFATAIGGTPMMERVFAELTDQGAHDLPFDASVRALYEASMFNSVASRIGAIVGAKNACITISTGCTAGLDAMGWAYESIVSGDARVMIAGAAEAPLANITFASFEVIGALSRRNHEPERASRPFDRDRDGFVVAEGAAFLVLEDLDHAKARKAVVLAEVLGFASSGNAFHMTDLPPEGEALGRTLIEIFAQSEIEPGQVGYVNAHGSSTRQNDVFETNAYKTGFGADAYRIPTSSTKSMIGHPLAAASAIGTVAAITAITTQKVPPTINLEQPDPACDLDYVPGAVRSSPIKNAIVTASGFSGIHSALLLGPPDRCGGEEPEGGVRPDPAPSTAGRSFEPARIS